MSFKRPHFQSNYSIIYMEYRRICGLLNNAINDATKCHEEFIKKSYTFAWCLNQRNSVTTLKCKIEIVRAENKTIRADAVVSYYKRRLVEIKTQFWYLKACSYKCQLEKEKKKEEEIPKKRKKTSLNSHRPSRKKPKGMEPKSWFSKKKQVEIGRTLVM